MEFEQFFGLKDNPFKLAPEPEYFYPGDIHREAFQTLLLGLQTSEGFLQLTGGAGTGKTITLKTLKQHLGSDFRRALVLNPHLSPQEFYQAILQELGIKPPELDEHPIEELRRIFLEGFLDMTGQGQKLTLLIDEAQALPPETLSELNRLALLETEGHKALRMVLAGEIDLADKLQEPGLQPLAERITGRHHLRTLTKEDTSAYVQHRLRVAGLSQASPFSSRILNDIHKYSQGLPRLINIICERALMAAFVDGQKFVEKGHVARAVSSIAGEDLPPKSAIEKKAGGSWAVAILLGLQVVAILAVAYYLLFYGRRPSPPPKDQPVISTKAQKEPAPTTTQKEPGPAKPSKEQADQGPLLPGPGAATTPSTASSHEAAPKVPLPPAGAFAIPLNRSFLTIDRDRKKAYLWEGSAGRPGLKVEFSWPDPPPAGLYVLGQDANKKKYLFGFPRSTKELTQATGQPWAEVADLLSNDILPVYVASFKSEAQASVIDRARQVTRTLQTWAETWRKKDLDGHMQHYGDRFFAFVEDKKAPEVFTYERLHKRKHDVFQQSGNITLTVTDPLCFLDPTNPEMVMAVFSQKYTSKSYSDSGVQAVYFQLIQEDGGPPLWKMVARLWVPRLGSTQKPKAAAPGQQ